MRNLIFLSIVFFFSQFLYSQLPYEFTLKTHNTDYTCAHDIAFGEDGTIFVANGSDGLCAYKYYDNSLTNVACDTNEYCSALAVVVDSAGMIYSTNEINLGAGVNTKWSLDAYSYCDYSFTNTASMPSGWAGGPYDGKDIAIGAVGTIFVAGSGLYAYYYDDSSFICSGYIYDGSDGQGIAIGLANMIFLANGSDGLRAYTYEDSVFTNIAHINNGGYATDVVFSADGTIFLANGSDGLRAYSYEDSSFTNIAHIDDGGAAFGAAIGADGTIFLANGADGLRAYTYIDTIFINKAHFTLNTDNLPGAVAATSISIGADSTIFLATDYEGLFVLDYSGYVGIEDVDLSIPQEYGLFQNYPNPFNPKTVISYQLPVNSSVEISIYNILGQKVTTLVNKKQPAGVYTIEWDATGFASGVYFYRLEMNKGFMQTRKLVVLK